MDKKQNSQGKSPAANTKNQPQKSTPSQPNKTQQPKKSNW